MISFLLQPGNLPFAIALGVVSILGLIEGIGAVVGFALSSLLDGLLPDLDIDGPEVPDHGAVSEFLSWLRVREVPVIFVLLAFLMSFALTGLILQQIVVSLSGFMLPGLVAAPAALFPALPCTRLFAGILSKIMPQDETSAVSHDSFIGRTATITLGTAKAGQAAQAKLRDQHGQDHYIMLEPDDAALTFAAGETVLVVRGGGARFFAIPISSASLTDA